MAESLLRPCAVIAGVPVPYVPWRAEHDGLLGLFDWQRAEQRLVEQRIDRGVRSDAERQCEDGGQHEARRAARLARCEAKILDEIPPAVLRNDADIHA